MKKRSTFFNAVSVAASRLVGAIIGVLLFPLMLHRLGAEPLGLLSLAGSFSAVSGYMALLDFGLAPTLVVYIANYLGRDDGLGLSRLICTALLLYSVLALIGAAILFLITPLLINHVFNVSAQMHALGITLFRIMAVQVFVESIGTVARSTLEGAGNYRLTQGTLAVGNIAQAGATAVILLINANLVSIAITQLVVSVLIYVVLAALVRRVLPQITIRPSLVSINLLKELFSFSKPIFGQQISGLAFRQADRFVVGTFLSVSLVAHYDVIQKVYRLAMMPQGFSAVILPTASSAVAMGDQKDLQNIFLQNTRYALASTSSVALVTIILAPWLLQYWIGSSFVYLVNMMRAFLILAMGASAVAVGTAMLTPMGKAGRVMLFGLLSSMVSLIGSMLLVQRFQLAGIVYSSLAAAALNWTLNIWLILKELDLSFWDFAFPILRTFGSVSLGMVPLGILLLFHSPASIFEVIAYGAVGAIFSLTMFLSTGLEHHERTVLYQLALRRINRTV